MQYLEDASLAVDLNLSADEIASLEQPCVPHEGSGVVPGLPAQGPNGGRQR